MKKYVVFGFVFVTKILTAQTIKTYSGSYEVDGINFFSKNTATYQYYDDANYNRIYHGKFDFNHGQVTGYYSNNKRTGLWKWIKKRPSYVSYRENFPGYTVTVTGNYQNGKKNGLWRYERRDLITKKLTLSSTANFKNDTLIGKYAYFDITKVHPSNDERNIVVYGQFDDNGAIDGDWLITYYKYKVPFEEVRKYKNGVLYWKLHRNMSTGEILEQVDQKELLDLYFEKRDLESNTAIIKNSTYEIVPREALLGLRLNFNYVMTFWHHFEKEDSDNEMYQYKFPGDTYTNVVIFKELVQR